MAAAALVASSLAPAAPVLAEGEAVLHTVQPGENLFRIALRYSVPQRAILAANGLSNPDYVRAGQVLVIPADGATVLPAVQRDVLPLPGDGSAATEAARVVVQPESGPAPQAAAADGVRLHTVQRGENLFRIALQYGVSVSAIVQANSLPNANVVAAGQTLVVPDGSGFGGGVRDANDAGAGFQPLVSTPSGFPTVPASQNEDGVDFTPAPWFRLTHYCLPGRMASGRTVYPGAVAADASIFPLGTRLLIEGYGFFTVEDRFAWDARQPRLDVWVPGCWEAVQRGVVYRRVFVVEPR